MNLREYLLTQLISECAEVIHRATKAQHFGLTEIQEGQALNNQERLDQEFIDLIATYQLLVYFGYLKINLKELKSIQSQIDAKILKIVKYMEHAAKNCHTIPIEEFAWFQHG